MSSFKKDDGTGMQAPVETGAAGAVSSSQVGRKNPSQGKLRSGINDQRSMTRIDRNKHGIRRETNMGPKKTGRPKKV
jgi:hypothetical protein